MTRVTVRIFAVAIALVSPFFASGAASQEIPDQSDRDVFEEQVGRGIKNQRGANSELSSNAHQLAQLLRVVEPIALLKRKLAEDNKSTESLVQTILLRQKIQQSIQYAALELEEALANIDGDLSSTNMQLSFLSAKHDRSILLSNVATFVGAGTLGILDSATGLKLPPPTPNIFGIAGNTVSVGLPLIGLRRAKYQDRKQATAEGNMLAPIFGRPYGGEAYDPIVWNYLEAVPARSTTNQSRRRLLLRSWQAYRGLDTARGAEADSFVDALVGLKSPNRKVTLDLLKTRSEMLVDLRALVQQMYRDISELNTSVMGL